MATRIRTTVTAIAVLALSLVSVAPAAADHEPEYDRRSDEWTLVEHLQFPQGTDLFFQRREGRQHLDGEVIDDTRDYLFAGNDASGAVGDPPEGEPLGINVYDVTDPTAPVELAVIDCPGYHADVAVYENLLIQAIDNTSGAGCAEEFDPDGVDQAETAGIRIFDISDPADPFVVGFVTGEELDTEVHNITTLPWAGLVYIAGSEFNRPDPKFAYVDLDDPEFPATVIPMNDISPSATAECHDIGVAQLDERDLAFCAAVEETFIWDISDPTDPQHVSVVPLAAESIHHAARLAPDGTTLVLNDELGGAAVAPGCGLPTTQDPLGALWFFDISDPSTPQLQGTFSTSEVAGKLPCTSHFFNFIPGSTLLTVSWYKSGMVVVDYGNLPETIEHAVFTPTGGDFWASYYWHGYIYGNSFGADSVPDYGGEVEDGGVWITQLAGLTDVDPSPHDQGTVWSPWNQQLPEPEPEPEPAPEPEEEAAQAALPTTGGGGIAALLGLVLLGAVVTLRRRSS